MASSGQSTSYRLGVLASGGGTNLQSILDKCASGEIPATVAVVIGNNSKSGALARASDAGVNALHLSGHTHKDPGSLDLAICSVLDDHGVDLVLLAGYMKKLGPVTLARYTNRILNIHPALLPDFGGQGMYGERVHQAVVESGAKHSGATVHIVNEEYDQGPVVYRKVLDVAQGETAGSLAKRVLNLEHELYAEVVTMFALGKVKIQGTDVEITD